MPAETIFAEIAAGDRASHTVYEDEHTYAFLDADPVAPGHTLVIPREPVARLQALPSAVRADLLATVARLVPAVEAGVGADATTVTLNNGPAAGQEIPHVHWHIVPRFEDDGTLVEYSRLVDPDEIEIASVAAAIREATAQTNP